MVPSRMPAINRVGAIVEIPVPISIPRIEMSDKGSNCPSLDSPVSTMNQQIIDRYAGKC